MELLEIWYLQGASFVLFCLVMHFGIKMKNILMNENNEFRQSDPRLYPIEKGEDEIFKTAL